MDGATDLRDVTGTLGPFPLRELGPPRRSGRLEGAPETGSAPDSPLDSGGSWADFAAARGRFLALCRRQAEIARLEARSAKAAPATGSEVSTRALTSARAPAPGRRGEHGRIAAR